MAKEAVVPYISQQHDREMAFVSDDKSNAEV